MSLSDEQIARADQFATDATAHTLERPLNAIERERVVVAALMAVPPFPSRLNATNAYRAWLARR